MSFVHLHVHTEYSLLDGAARISDLVKKCKEYNMNSLAITDHGAMYGVIEFYNECKKQGIKPVIGCEFYICKDMNVKEKGYSHIILLAKNNEGYSNLLKLCSKAYIEGYYYKPRIDYDTLKNHANGIVCLSACLAGDLPRLAYKEDYEGAKNYINQMKSIFGQDSFYIELQDHGIPMEKIVYPRLVELSRQTDTPLALTNDVHYVNIDDANAQDVLLCIQTNTFVDQKDRMRMDSDQMYLKNEQEMSVLFPECKDAMENTQKIADMCNVEIDFNTMHLPKYDVPDNKTSYQYLKELCIEGLRDKGFLNNEKYIDRLNYELEVIRQMGFDDYFLIVWDYVNFARKNDIPVGPGRGSAAGSLCAYCLEITNIDPIRFNLLFERFLNPERISMPDIDMDFCTIRRQEIIDYVVKKYGDDKVAQIITFNTLAAKNCIKSVARVNRFPFDSANKLTKLIPNELKMTIEKALKTSSDLNSLYEQNEDIKEIIDISLKLEGLPSHAGTHAAGVVISKQPLSNIVPLQKNDDIVTTQFPMGDIEKLGLLKMDFLGLRNLNVIQNALNLIKQNTGISIDIDNIDFEDKKVYEMISSGDTDGVFQLESSGMRSFLQELKPDNFEDIIAGISLYRPGPMDQIPTYVMCKKDPNKVKYMDKKLEPILKMTYGCMVYQEQVMQIVRDLAGYSLGRSDLVRRAMAKKKEDVMNKEREIFIHGDGNEVLGAVKMGTSESVANKIFDQMIDFAQYAFNRSHAAAYGVLAYQTAYLKAYYPKEFIAATINSYKGDNEKISKYVNYCKKNDINVVNPDINISEAEFITTENSIVFGFVAIKNVGHGAAMQIVQERQENGKYVDFYSFCKRTKTILNKRMVESLIYAGCFDTLGYTRSSLISCYERILTEISGDKAIDGQISLFESSSSAVVFEIPVLKEMDSKRILEMEKDRTGLYLSGHPLDEYTKVFDNVSCNTLKIKEGEYKEGDVVTIFGMVIEKRNLTTKNNNMMAYLTFEDLYDSISIVVFPKPFNKYSQMIGVGSIIKITGKLNFDENDVASLVLDSVTSVSNNYAKKVLQIKTNSFDTNYFNSIMQGKDIIEVYLNVDGKWKKSVTNNMLISDEVIDNAKIIFGEQNIRVL